MPLVQWKGVGCGIVKAWIISDFMNYPCSDFASSEEETVECLKKIDEAIMEMKTYAEMSKERTNKRRRLSGGIV